RLPQSVQRLRSTTAGDLDAEVEPIRVSSSDEVGDVATAFNVVHREAVRIAVEQAVLRRNVSTMFVNLSRRTQSLVERQLRLIDDLEVNEENTDSLGNLFQLDHLATRMRRNAENLLVLAGADSGRRWNHPVALIDVLRAAAAEVEQYPRVAQTYVTTREIDGRAVGDVVHLVAEMLENALEFSSPETQVVVSGRSLSGDAGLMVEIEDRGIGMSADELATANERLATAAEIDVGLSRMMGLYVVGKLAARHSIGVHLRHAANGGVLAQIHLPGGIVTGRADGPDEMDTYLRSRAGEGPVPVTAGAPAITELADLGDHETRPIIVERTRTRPRPLSRPEDDHDGPHALRGLPDGRNDEAVLPTRGPGQPGDGQGGHVGLPRRDGGSSTTGTFRMPAGPPSGGGSVGPDPDGDRADMAAPVPELPEFDFGMDLDNVLSGGGRPTPQEADGRELPDPDGQGLTAAGLPRRDAVNREDQHPDLFPPDTSQTQLFPPDTPQTQLFPPSLPSPPGSVGSVGSQSLQGQRDLPAPTDLPGRPDLLAQPDLSGPPSGPPPLPLPRRQTRPVEPADPAEPARPASAPGSAPRGSTTDRPEPTPEKADEYLPIYAQVESEWFRRRTRPAAAGADRQPAARRSWESVADEGWRAAEQIAKPRVSGTTRAGLPIRQPQAHYVPGSAGSVPRATGPDGEGPTAGQQSPQEPAGAG
ncbi:MAG TPA: ATP-binding protein, partial [Mycobacteriales bacterium]